MTDVDVTKGGTVADSGARVLAFQLYELQTVVFASHATFGLILYDYFLTLSAETDYMWSARKTLLFYFFIGARYGALVTVILGSMSTFVPLSTSQGCAWIIYPAQIMSCAYSISLSGIFILRTYAIHNKNKLVLCALLALTIPKDAIGVIDTFILIKPIALSGPARRFMTCNAAETRTSVELLEAGLILLFAFDTLVLVLTLLRTVRLSVDCRKLGLGMGLSWFMLRDGILHYLCVLLDAGVSLRS